MIYDLRFRICSSIRNSRRSLRLAGLALLLSTFNLQPSTALAFEGRIRVVATQGGQAMPLLYTVGTNFLRVEMTETNWPNPVDILDRNSDALTLIFPHNRSYVRLKPVTENPAAMPPGFLPMPAGLPSGAGPQPRPPTVPAMPSGLPPTIGPTNLSGMPAMPNPPAMPMMPRPMMENMELKATGEKTNLLGFVCEKFEIKQRGETMEIWATDSLLPFQNYVRNQPPRFGPRMIEEQWAGLLTAKKLFPLRASLHFENGPERYHFEVQSITPQKLKDEDMKLFQPPVGYFEIEPLPF
jgi:Domain of unknown function (DUF4412)